MPLELQNALEKIGLSDKEIRILLVLLGSGSMFVAAIAKVAKLNRTTAYGILKELTDRGLVSTIKKEGAVQYQSIEPDLLPGYIERRGNELLATKEIVTKLVPQLKLVRAKRRALPKIKFFEGKEGVEQAYEDTLENNQEKQLYEITGIDGVYTKLDPKFVRYYLDKRTRLGITSTYITPDTEIARRESITDEKYIRKAKFIPKQFGFNAEIALYDDKVGVFSYSQESPVALIIEDATIAHTMKQLFNYMVQTTLK